MSVTTAKARSPAKSKSLTSVIEATPNKALRARTRARGLPEPLPSLEPDAKRSARPRPSSLVKTFAELKADAYSVGLQDLEVALSVHVVDQACTYLEIGKGELMGILGLKASSVSTWAKKPGALLPLNESDRLARLARITGVIERAMESRNDAIEWLHASVPALGFKKPISLLGTDAGTRMVEHTLMRSLAGVYA